MSPATCSRLRPLARRSLAAATVVVLCVLSAARAEQVQITAVDSAGHPLADVVLALYPAAGLPAGLSAPADAVIAQQGMQFQPYLSVIRVRTRVSFPNRDNMEHRLKSFSATKEFEFTIYSSGSPPPVLFDKPRPVSLYCLLHDWMRGFIYVVDTPYYGATDSSGSATITDLPAGKYEVRAWHPIMSSYLPPLVAQVTLGSTGSDPIRFSFPFQPKKRPTPHPVN